MYEMRERIRFSETDGNLKLTCTGLIDLLQDCATFHSEDVGFTCQMLGEQDLGWFVTNWQVHLNALPSIGDRIVVRTYPYHFRGMMASRYFVIEGEDGTLYATANSIWVLMNRKTNKPQRAPKEMIEAYAPDEDPTEEFESRKIPVEAGLVEAGRVVVDTSFLDTNGHVNNGRYVQLASHVLLQDSSYRAFFVEYKQQARLGDEITILKRESEDHIQVVLADQEGNPYVVTNWKK
ncbi:Acyl-ACP thioesterase [Lachnospiraceae bacterium C10]|nr:Acyl-ACP thioesterase [Lachnospiraceae bacterium C10]